MKIYDATFSGIDTGKPQTLPPSTVPVAAQSLTHAARKAAAAEGKRGELIKIELSDKVII